MSGTRKETVVYDPSQGTGHYEPAPHCQLIEPASLVVVEMNDVRSRHEFCWLFRYVKPRAVFDLRIRPVFYIDVNLNHSGVLRLFEDVSTEYFDLVTGLLGIDDKDHPGLKPPSLGAAISTQLAALAKPCFPIVLLAARRETAQEFLSAMPRYLFPKPPGGWNGILHRDLLDRTLNRGHNVRDTQSI